MFEHLTWLDDRVLLGDLVFRIEHARNDRWELGDRCFRFYKTRPLVEQYERFWSNRTFRPRHMLEIGIWDGGSTAFWWEHLRPEKIIAIDLMDRADSAYFREYVERNELEGRVEPRWRTNQADRAQLRRIVEHDFGGVIDLVIDDGSHRYAPTKASFETIFPLMPAGGLYIVEDWAWEHDSGLQDPSFILGSDQGLSRLVREVIEAAGSSKTLIRSVTVFEGFAVIERGEDQLVDFRLEDHITRRPWHSAAEPARRDEEVKPI